MDKHISDSEPKNWAHDLRSSIAVLETCYRDSEANEAVKKMFRVALDQIEALASRMERASKEAEALKNGDIHA